MGEYVTGVDLGLKISGKKSHRMQDEIQKTRIHGIFQGPWSPASRYTRLLNGQIGL
jgi:hypothetical protein